MNKSWRLQHEAVREVIGKVIRKTKIRSMSLKIREEMAFRRKGNSAVIKIVEK